MCQHEALELGICKVVLGRLKGMNTGHTGGRNSAVCGRPVSYMGSHAHNLGLFFIVPVGKGAGNAHCQRKGGEEYEVARVYHEGRSM